MIFRITRFSNYFSLLFYQLFNLVSFIKLLCLILFKFVFLILISELRLHLIAILKDGFILVLMIFIYFDFILSYEVIKLIIDHIFSIIIYWENDSIPDQKNKQIMLIFLFVLFPINSKIILIILYIIYYL